MRRPLVIYDFLTDPSEFTYAVYRKNWFSFLSVYTVDCGNQLDYIQVVFEQNERRVPPPGRGDWQHSTRRAKLFHLQVWTVVISLTICRWFSNRTNDVSPLLAVETGNILPVELNSFICRSERGRKKYIFNLTFLFFLHIDCEYK